MSEVLAWSYTQQWAEEEGADGSAILLSGKQNFESISDFLSLFDLPYTSEVFFTEFHLIAKSIHFHF
jgi:hypothetical protein